MSGVVVPFRPRSEVPHRAPVIRTPEPECRLNEAMPVTIEAGVRLMDLFRALTPAGLSLCRDDRTGALLIRRGRT